MIKVVIFDYGGVTGYEPFESDVSKAIARKFGIGYENVYKNYKSLENSILTNKISKRTFLVRFAKTLKIPEKKLEITWDNHFGSKPKVNKKVVKIVGDLKRRGYKIALLSNVYKHRAIIIRKNGDYRIFPNVFLSCDIGIRKPDKKIYEHVIEKLKAKPEECIFIDDREINLAPARKLGFKTILFKNTVLLKKELKKYL